MKAAAGRKSTLAKTPEGRSRKGQDREHAVLHAARRVLVQSGYTQFSLRNVAAEAGMHLSNLQYYFPTRNALIQRMLAFVEEHYERKYAERFTTLPADPMPRFVAMVEYLIDDIHSPQTRRFFIQLWALLESTDRRAQLLNSLYSGHIASVARYINDINPGLSLRIRQQRATMIVAMIDGMMLMLDDADLHTRPGEPAISAAMRNQILRIATDPP